MPHHAMHVGNSPSAALEFCVGKEHMLVKMPRSVVERQLMAWTLERPAASGEEQSAH